METNSTALTPTSPPLALRSIRFEEVAEVLRLVGRAVAFGCREHYTAEQRAVVFTTYARGLFIESLGPFENVAAEREGRIVGFAQLDGRAGRLRALFVDPVSQGHGVGRALVAEIEARAARHGCTRLHGSMSLNAVPFYKRVGFLARGGPESLGPTGADIDVPIVRMEKRL
jgi:GNAT superfamily N-acetyltransferase